MELGIDSDGDGFQVEKLEELDPHSCATTSTTTAGHATPPPRSIQPLQPRPIPTNAAALAPRNPALGSRISGLGSCWLLPSLGGGVLGRDDGMGEASGGGWKWRDRCCVGGSVCLSLTN
jgi:hypothetical protein